jgi:hypothetical protein
MLGGGGVSYALHFCHPVANNMFFQTSLGSMSYMHLSHSTSVLHTSISSAAGSFIYAWRPPLPKTTHFVISSLDSRSARPVRSQILTVDYISFSHSQTPPVSQEVISTQRVATAVAQPGGAGHGLNIRRDFAAATVALLG